MPQYILDGGKNGKLIAIAKIFGPEEVLKTQFHHAKETKNAEIDALIYLGRRKCLKHNFIMLKRTEVLML